MARVDSRRPICRTSLGHLLQCFEPRSHQLSKALNLRKDFMDMITLANELLEYHTRLHTMISDIRLSCATSRKTLQTRVAMSPPAPWGLLSHMTSLQAVKDRTDLEWISTAERTVQLALSHLLRMEDTLQRIVQEGKDDIGVDKTLEDIDVAGRQVVEAVRKASVHLTNIHC